MSWELKGGLAATLLAAWVASVVCMRDALEHRWLLGVLFASGIVSSLLCAFHAKLYGRERTRLVARRVAMGSFIASLSAAGWLSETTFSMFQAMAVAWFAMVLGALFYLVFPST